MLLNKLLHVFILGAKFVAHGLFCLLHVSFPAISSLRVEIADRRPTTASWVLALAMYLPHLVGRERDITKHNIIIVCKFLSNSVPGGRLLDSSASAL